jgi:hypothetical protein
MEAATRECHQASMLLNTASLQVILSQDINHSCPSTRSPFNFFIIILLKQAGDELTRQDGGPLV